MLLKLSCTRNASLAWGLAGLAVMAMGITVNTAAVAGEIYSWQTEHGDVAFADDPKKIPARYRDQVVSRAMNGLGDYERFSSGDGEEAANYPDQLAARLDYLRRVNAQPARMNPNQGNAQGIASIRVQGMDLRVDGGETSAPLVIEQVRVIGAGQIASRHDTVVRQGDRTLAIVRGHQSGEIDALSNILDEEDLESYE